MRINTNLAALNAWRNLTANGVNLQKSLEKLSSGFRINRAADDAAGLAVSEKMRAQIRGVNMSIKTSQDGISLLQTAEGALTESHSMLQRMRELAVQSSTSTLQDADRALLQEEFSQLQSEITRIGNATQFNGKNLLDGSAGVSVTTSSTFVSNLSGTGDTQAATYSISGVTLATKGDVFLYDYDGTTAATFSGTSDTFATAQTVTVNGKSYSFAAGTTVQSAIDTLNTDTATTKVVASFGTSGIKFATSDPGSAQKVTLTSNLATTLTTDSAVLTAAVTSSTESGTDAQIGTVGGAAVNYEAVGNKITVLSGNAKGLSLTVAGTTATAFNVTVGTNGSLSIQTGSQAGQSLNIGISDMRASALGVNTLSIGTSTGASSAITSLDTAINTVSTQRAKLGAYQNRLEYTVSSQSATAENLSAAESRIRDVDMAAEMANFTKWQILSQASTAMLAQANQSTQGVLTLLR